MCVLQEQADIVGSQCTRHQCYQEADADPALMTGALTLAVVWLQADQTLI